MSANTKNNAKLTIGRLAEAAGVSIATVRFYQRRSLLPVPKKPKEGGFRLYSEDNLRRLLAVRPAQELGFTLSEVSDLLTYIDTQDCEAMVGLASKKLEQVKLQADLLKNTQKKLTQLIVACPEGCPDDCPFIIKLCGDGGPGLP